MKLVNSARKVVHNEIVGSSSGITQSTRLSTNNNMAIHFFFNNKKVLTEPEDGDVVVNDGILMARWLQSQHDSLLLLVIRI